MEIPFRASLALACLHVCACSSEADTAYDTRNEIAESLTTTITASCTSNIISQTNPTTNYPQNSGVANLTVNPNTYDIVSCQFGYLINPNNLTGATLTINQRPFHSAQISVGRITEVNSAGAGATYASPNYGNAWNSPWTYPFEVMSGNSLSVLSDVQSFLRGANSGWLVQGNGSDTTSISVSLTCNPTTTLPCGSGSCAVLQAPDGCGGTVQTQCAPPSGDVCVDPNTTYSYTNTINSVNPNQVTQTQTPTILAYYYPSTMQEALIYYYFSPPTNNNTKFTLDPNLVSHVYLDLALEAATWPGNDPIILGHLVDSAVWNPNYATWNNPNQGVQWPSPTVDPNTVQQLPWRETSRAPASVLLSFEITSDVLNPISQGRVNNGWLVSTTKNTSNWQKSIGIASMRLRVTPTGSGTYCPMTAVGPQYVSDGAGGQVWAVCGTTKSQSAHYYSTDLCDCGPNQVCHKYWDISCQNGNVTYDGCYNNGDLQQTYGCGNPATNTCQYYSSGTGQAEYVSANGNSPGPLIPNIDTADQTCLQR